LPDAAVLIATADWLHPEIAMITVYDFKATALEGHEMPLSNYKGQVLLVVNTASKCGFTPQYDGLEALYRKYHAKGFIVLGFPCNQFGAQEPGDAADIARFCSDTYGVTFPMFEKTNVNGASAHPLYRFLKGEAKGVFGTGAIKWNFTKFLVDRSGGVVSRFAPPVPPKSSKKKSRSCFKRQTQASASGHEAASLLKEVHPPF
jgi:glutathione peroxidase